MLLSHRLGRMAVACGGRRASVAQVFADENHGVASCRMRVACEVDVVADALGRVAVVAYAVCQTRSLDVEACRINRTCRRACPCQCALNILCHLVESHDEYHVLGSEGYRCHAVAVAVDVYYHAVFAYGVDARQIVVARKSLAVNLLPRPPWRSNKPQNCGVSGS